MSLMSKIFSLSLFLSFLSFFLFSLFKISDQRRCQLSLAFSLAAGILRANVSFITERIPYASAEGAQASLRRTHAQGRVFRDGDPATRPPSRKHDHYRSRMNDVGTWRDISPCH